MHKYNLIRVILTISTSDETQELSVTLNNTLNSEKRQQNASRKSRIVNSVLRAPASLQFLISTMSGSLFHNKGATLLKLPSLYFTV